ncbi:MAG: DNA polymerase III subunit gamma/tau [Chloroflexi bacterium]|nr:DNA polymerase III subunit gamma/tau [Chloroflexota bacterium]
MFDGPSTPTSTEAPRQQEAHRALYLRWRPRRFEDVVGQEHVTRTLRNAVKLSRPSHAYLFTGPRGTGKTTVARILYRAVNCENAQDGDPCNTCALCRAALEARALDLVEIDAASTGGIADIRDLREKVGYRPNEGRYRVYIVDEAHEMSNAAWDALLKTLEEPPPHALFVLATTEAHKVPATIVSRCQRFDFRRIPFEATRDQLARVADAEGLHVDRSVLERLALVARGGLRDALSLLDQLSAFAVGDIDMSVARAALSLPSIEAVRGVIDGMTRHDAATVMAVVADAAEGGADLRLLADELVVHLRALMLLRSGADARLTDELPTDEVAWLRERAPAWSLGVLMQLIQTLSDALARTRDAAQFQVQTEVALLTACDIGSQAAPPAPAAPSARPSADATARSSHEPSPSHTVVETTAVAASVAAPSRPATVADPTSGDGANAEPTNGGGATAEPPKAEAPTASEPPAPRGDAQLRGRWLDVVDHVQRRNGLLASIVRSAEPLAVDDAVLVVAFSTEFNRKTAEKSTNRQLIETAFERVYGTAYRLRCTVASGENGLLDDPVINFAQRTFGGQPKRVPTE